MSEEEQQVWKGGCERGRLLKRKERVRVDDQVIENEVEHGEDVEEGWGVRF